MCNQVYPIVVIGAGASGMMAAVAASRMRPHSVLMVEKESRAGRKLLATGNGRCNLLNMQLLPSVYSGSGSHLARGILSMKTPSWLLSYWEALGLTCHEEAQGRVYPFSGQASTVLDILRLACEREGVDIRTDTVIRSIAKSGEHFVLHTGDGHALRAQRVIMAAGGAASAALGSDGSGFALMAQMGHEIVQTFAAIVPLKLEPRHIKGLKGVRVRADIALYVDRALAKEERGELLFTDYGVSGIAAMQMGRLVNWATAQGKQVELSVAFMPRDEAMAECARRAELFAGETMEAALIGLLHKRISQALLRAVHIPLEEPVAPQAMNRFAACMADWRLPVLGTLPLAQAQVTAGGARAGQFDEATLESYVQPGLYACGEVLDVDGDCGGYNLMWAWASGITAGEAAAQSLEGGEICFG